MNKIIYIALLFYCFSFSQQQTKVAVILQESGLACVTAGGLASDNGLKTWCWSDFQSIVEDNDDTTNLSNNELAINTAGNNGQVKAVGNEMTFFIDPLSPAGQVWSTESDYNYRAEISTRPWPVDNPVGTEEWFGWSYTFGNDYVQDSANGFTIFQVHTGVGGTNPLISLHIASASGAHTDNTGEIEAVNSADPNPFNTYHRTGIYPVAGDKVDIVIHVKWGIGNAGLYEVWLNGIQVLSAVEQTVFTANPVSGNAKWGIYYSPWRTLTAIQASAAVGVTKIATKMGALKMITYKPGATILGDEYNRVKPD